MSRRLAPLAKNALVDVDVLARWILVDEPRELHETPFRGIGCTLAEQRGEPAGLAERPRTLGDASAALRRALERTVARAIGDARRVAVMTGGGVDSGGLLGLVMQQMRERGGSAFAVALDYRADGDDGPHLEALERHLGCDVIRVAPEQAAHRAKLIEGVDGAPFGSPTGQMEIEVFARARAHGAELVLTGNGGDDLFDGVPQSLATLTREGRPLAALRAARALRGFGAPKRRLFTWALRPLLVPLVPRSVRMWRAHRARPEVPPWAGPVLRASIEERFRRLLDELDLRLANPQRDEPSPSEAMRVWIAWYQHQQEVEAGIERSDPYFDRELVQWVQALPPAWLLQGNIRRGLFREAIRGLVPESLRMRSDKAAFEPAMFRFVESIGGFASLRRLVSAERLADLGLVEPAPFLKAFDELSAEPIESWQWSRVWPALCAEAFLRGREARHDG